MAGKNAFKGFKAIATEKTKPRVIENDAREEEVIATIPEKK